MRHVKETLFSALLFKLCALVFIGCFTACDGIDDDWKVILQDEGSVVIKSVTRDNNNGTAVIGKNERGEIKDTTIVVPLGGVNFKISPRDTIQVSDNDVVSNAFALRDSTSSNYDGYVGNLRVFYTSTKKRYLHTLNKYSKDIEISYLDAYCYVWGARVEFPAANGRASYENLSVKGDGSYGNTTYFLSTTNYNVAFMKNSRRESGQKELAVNSNDKLIGVNKTDEGYDVVARDNDGNPIRGRSWIEVTSTYSNSGNIKQVYEVLLDCGIKSPDYDVKVLPNFELNQVSARLGSKTTGNTRKQGNITVTPYTQTFTVGNDRFTKNFVFSYETARWSDGTHTFDMPSREYTTISDNGFTMTNMAGSSTYDAKLNTHRISARFNGENVAAKAETEVRVNVPEEDRQTPSWLGDPVGAKYTRVQRKTGEQFMDMIVFEYQNGVVMAPEGQVNTSLIYAFTETLAKQHGVDRCIKSSTQNSSHIRYSGVWTGSKWAPAVITITNGRWIYAGLNQSWDHTVMENNAITLGIGVDVTPAPSAQSLSIQQGEITIKYPPNNGSRTATSSCSLK